MDNTNILTEDDSVSVCSASSDVSSVWGGAQDPITVNLRALRKDINFKNRVFTEEYSRVSKLSGDDLEVDSLEPDQQRVGLAEAICKYVRVSMAAIMEGYGDQNARMAVIMSIKKARNSYLTTGFLHPETLCRCPYANRSGDHAARHHRESDDASPFGPHAREEEAHRRHHHRHSTFRPERCPARWDGVVLGGWDGDR